MSLISENWEQIKLTVQNAGEISDIAFKTFIKPVKYFKEENNIVTAVIPFDNKIALSVLSKYEDIFNVVISEMMGSDYKVNIILEKDADIEAAPVKNNVYNINYETANLNPNYTFDTFVVGNSNKMAQAASLAVAENPGSGVYNPLFLCGGSGLGKTHLMHAIGHYILQQNPEMRILYVSSEDFVNEVVQSIRSGNSSSINMIREKYRTVDVLMIDDVQFIIGKESSQEEFFHTFNTLYQTGKQIILTSDRKPNELILDERYRSRFNMGLTYIIDRPDYETRLAILDRKADKCNVSFNKEVMDYIASNINTNIRDLEGALNCIIAYSRINRGVEINLEVAEEALKDIISPNSQILITPQYIAEIVAEQYDISLNDLFSKKRTANIALPRQVCMYLCCELTDSTLEEISKFLKRDHSTVIHGRDFIKSELDNKNNDKLIQNIVTIRKKISSV